MNAALVSTSFKNINYKNTQNLNYSFLTGRSFLLLNLVSSKLVSLVEGYGGKCLAEQSLKRHCEQTGDITRRAVHKRGPNKLCLGESPSVTAMILTQNLSLSPQLHPGTANWQFRIPSAVSCAAFGHWSWEMLPMLSQPQSCPQPALQTVALSVTLREKDPSFPADMLSLPQSQWAH